MDIKPLHIVILIGVLVGIIIYMYMKLNRVETDVSILKKKIENAQHLETTAKITDKSKDSITSSLSESTSSVSVKKKKPKKESPKQENNIFKTLGIPNIFEMFNVGNMDNLKNMDKFTSHPQFKNLESSSDTEDIDTSTVSIKRESSPKIIVSNIEVKNDNIVDIIQSESITQKENDISIIHTEDVNKIIVEEKKNDDEDMDKTEIDNNDNIETYSNSDNKTEKNNLEKLKLTELKEIAKKKNINVMNGKKPKNKTELINDILKS